MYCIGKQFGECALIHAKLLSAGAGLIRVGVFKGKRKIENIAVGSGLTQQGRLDAVVQMQIIQNAFHGPADQHVKNREKAHQEKIRFMAGMAGQTGYVFAETGAHKRRVLACVAAAVRGPGERHEPCPLADFIRAQKGQGVAD